VELHQAVEFAKGTTQGLAVGKSRNGDVDSIYADYKNQHIVVKNKEHTTIVPFGNIKYMLPLEEKSKPRNRAQAVTLPTPQATPLPNKDPLTAPPAP